MSNNDVGPLKAEEELTKIQRESVQKIHTLTEAITSTIQKYAHSEESSDEIINNPTKVYREATELTKQLTEVWKEHLEKVNSATQCPIDEDEFRSAYINQITEAFADELDDLRQGRPLRKDDGKKSKKSKHDSDILKQDNILMPEDQEMQEGGNVDVEVLKYMLETGMDDWSKEEKHFLMLSQRGGLDNQTGSKDMDLSGDGDVTMSTEILTPHEKRRRELFGNITL